MKELPVEEYEIVKSLFDLLAMDRQAVALVIGGHYPGRVFVFKRLKYELMPERFEEHRGWQHRVPAGYEIRQAALRIVRCSSPM